MKYEFGQELSAKLAETLNSDPAFLQWSRVLTAIVVFNCNESSFSLSIKNGKAGPCCNNDVSDVHLSGDSFSWKKALNTTYHKGFYDVTEAPDLLTLQASPYLIASNAKAFDRMWKHLRSLLNGEERKWDWNV